MPCARTRSASIASSASARSESRASLSGFSPACRDASCSYLQSDQVLLRSVVEVALEPPTLLVWGGHQPLPRCLEVVEPREQLRRQPDVAENEPGLRSEIIEQLLFGGSRRVAASIRDCQRTEELVPV